MPQGPAREASLVIELSKKPLIILFWLGALTVFISGVLSILQAQRQRPAPQVEEAASDSPAEKPGALSGNTVL